MSAERFSYIVSLLTTLWVAVFLSIPLYRPYLVATKQVSIIYIVFGITGLIALERLWKLYSSRLNAVDWLIHGFFALYALFSIANAQTFAVDKAGLLAFLFVSYVYGRTHGSTFRVHQVISWVTIIFLIVSLYINFQLSNNGFSYNRYYNWSTAQFKLGYLDYALFGVIALLCAMTRHIPSGIKIPLCCYICISVAISGARYSILFLLMVFAWRWLALAKRGQAFGATILGFMAVFLAIVLAVVFKEEQLVSSMFEYSLNRMGALVTGDTSVSARVSVFDSAVAAIGSSPLFGYGMGQGGLVLGVNYPHNIVFEIALETGVLAGALFLATLGLAAWKAIRSLFNSDLDYLALAVLFVIGAYLKSFSLYESRVLFFLLGVAGALAHSNSIRRRVRISSPPPNLLTS